MWRGGSWSWRNGEDGCHPKESTRRGKYEIRSGENSTERKGRKLWEDKG